MMDITNVMFAGVGGQGILTSGRLLALAALHAGLDVKMSEVHGMSQRGGNVDTHVRIGPEVPSSLIPKGGAHFLVSFEKLEALRYLDYLRPDGVAFVIQHGDKQLGILTDLGHPFGQLSRLLAELDAAVRPIEVRITAGADLKFQGFCGRVESPDPDEGNLEMSGRQLAAALEHRLKLGAGIERHRHLGIESGHAHAFLERHLGARALLDFAVQFMVRFV